MIKYAEGTIHCKDCGVLCWEKDTRKGRCIDCLVKYYEKKLKMQPVLFDVQQ
jgi:hypothetical protein